MVKSVKEMIDNKGKRIPALTIVQKEPDVAAAISKLIQSRDPVKNINNKINERYLVNPAALKGISDSSATQINDNENTTQLFPDIELVIQIVVSSVLAPKDMVKTELIYKTLDSVVPTVLHSKMIDIIKRALKTTYKLEADLSTILREALFTTGSHIRAVLPESLVDDVINGRKDISLENLNELFENHEGKVVSLGLLGSPFTTNKSSKLSMVLESLNNYKTNISTEEKYIGTFTDNKFVPLPGNVIEVTDNFKLLKLPMINKRHITNTVRNKYIRNLNISEEAYGDKNEISSAEFSSMVYKGVNGGTEPFIILPSKHQLKRKSIGRPLVLKLPTESVIPVCIPGDPKKHVGYFVLVDMDGNPVSGKSETASMDANGGLDSLRSSANYSSADNNNLAGSLIEKAKRNLINQDKKDVVVSDIVKVYGSIIEKDLIERLKNGIYKSEMAITGNEEIYRIMLARSIANKYCRLIYIPSEFVTYFAFKHHSSGIGKSYLDDLKILTSIRAISLFSKVMAHIKSSLNITG